MSPVDFRSAFFFPTLTPSPFANNPLGPTAFQPQLPQSQDALRDLFERFMPRFGMGSVDPFFGGCSPFSGSGATGSLAAPGFGMSAACWPQNMLPPSSFPFTSLSGLNSSMCPTPMPSLPPSLPIDCGPGQPASGSRAFVIGDLKKFGGSTVRFGLQEMLRPLNGQKDRPGERTHSAITAEDAQKVRALLNSQDPNVRATLAMKVPSGKSFVIGEDGRLLDTVNTREAVVGNASLNVAAHAQHMHDRVGRNFDRSAGGQIATANGNYSVIGTELHSPIKIALDGKNAELNSGNGFKIAMNGFGGGTTQTAGGLNANEAWLVRDRDGQGVVRNGVVNGNDVYGDHNGRFKDGYQDLARDFANEVKVDPTTGKHYIDLTDPNSRAARELKLLDANGQTRPAASILKRIDVDGRDVREADAADANEIRERAAVTYRDGHTASSADQWFATRPVRW